MYLGGTQAAQANSKVHCFIQHGSNPDGILGSAPLSIHINRNGGGHELKKVNFSTTTDITFESSVPAMSFVFDAHVDCGSRLFADHQFMPFTVDGWFMFCEPNMSTISIGSDHTFTIVSSGDSAKDALHKDDMPNPWWRLCKSCQISPDISTVSLRCHRYRGRPKSDTTCFPAQNAVAAILD